MDKQDDLKNRLQKALDYNDKKAADLAKDLNIPKSAVSQYLSGRSKNMPSERMYAICKYLNVSEAWMMGFDVSMERPIDHKSLPETQKKSGTIADAVLRMKNDSEFLSLVETLMELDSEQIKSTKTMLSAFLK
mgnify:CR=1 FL=1